PCCNVSSLWTECGVKDLNHVWCTQYENETYYEVEKERAFKYLRKIRRCIPFFQRIYIPRYKRIFHTMRNKQEYHPRNNKCCQISICHIAITEIISDNNIPDQTRYF